MATNVRRILNSDPVPHLCLLRHADVYLVPTQKTLQNIHKESVNQSQKIWNFIHIYEKMNKINPLSVDFLSSPRLSRGITGSLLLYHKPQHLGKRVQTDCQAEGADKASKA
ncbi:hypothetical protein ACI01nite_18250 [Acetobacter cibinongensis]|uniref:Uncharacterized protein n=1 Tax=Acetobacter cibinongensis TaxID=146475 RepID=A0A0D6N1U1_9PROT|nr:hypothetical protein [Acetobacter cibinongensis]GAN59700.1 hypothetical protein Abci_007_103 [Acetobacter cibinongensis]GBQ15168.1 hypothetical protein AA0482_1144 [Acetobacter cibinongensis NRIC 0482]GEL59223.1 hypothetical protein ACI01nite_18250 [Acetobacter cibinongensis]